MPVLTASLTGKLLVAYGVPFVDSISKIISEAQKKESDLVIVYDTNPILDELEKAAGQDKHLFVVQRKVAQGEPSVQIDGVLGFVPLYGIVVLASKIIIDNNPTYFKSQTFIKFGGVGKIVSAISRDLRCWHRFIMHVEGVVDDLKMTCLEFE